MKFGTKLTRRVPPMTPGTKMGICVGFVGIGEQMTTYKGSSTRKDQVLVTIEFPSEKVEIDGEMKPRQLSKSMTRTTDKKGTFSKTVSSWFAKNFTEEELEAIGEDDLLMRPCMVTVSLSDDEQYANIDNIVQYPEGLPIPTTTTVPFSFDVEEWDDEVFKTLPEWIQDKIKKSTQYAMMHAPETVIEVKEEVAKEDVCPI